MADDFSDKDFADALGVAFPSARRSLRHGKGRRKSWATAMSWSSPGRSAGVTVKG